MKINNLNFNVWAVACLLIITFCTAVNAQDNATVTIGGQTWCSKNLDVTTYSNGDVIPQVVDPTKWASLKTGAWCYYENKTANGTTYGKLYNWYAIHDKRGLAPKGFHIPADAEWKTLIVFLGSADAGKKMKSKSGWKANCNGTNESGFNGLPGGYRNGDGVFTLMGSFGDWWSTTEYRPLFGWSYSLDCSGSNLGRAVNYKLDGLSVRCLVD